MAIGHFMMAVEQLFLFALGALILGNGAFKPNISTQVGGLYAPGDPRRDRAFSIFYVGINVGAFLAPLVCGTLGEKARLALRLCRRRRRHAGRARHLSLRHAAPAAGRSCRRRRQGASSESRSTATNGAPSCALLVPVPAQYAVLGDLRAAGQHDRTMGRCQHRPDGRFSRVDCRNSDDLVPGLQSLHDLRLHAVRGRVVEAAGGAGEPSHRP